MFMPVLSLSGWEDLHYSTVQCYIRPFSWNLFVSYSLIIGYCVSCDFYKAQMPHSILTCFSIIRVITVCNTSCVHSGYKYHSAMSFVPFIVGFYLFISQGHKQGIHRCSSVPLVMVLYKGSQSKKVLVVSKPPNFTNQIIICFSIMFRCPDIHLLTWVKTHFQMKCSLEMWKLWVCF